MIGVGAAVALLLLVWGIVIEPRLFVEERHTVQIPALPEPWETQEVALIADPQVGMWLGNSGTVKRIVERIVELRPAALFIAGDFVYEPLGAAASASPNGGAQAAQQQRDELQADVEEVISILQPLAAAQIPAYAVLGNHDYAERSQQASLPSRSHLVRAALEKAGIHVLVDDALPLTPPSGATASSGPQQLWLVGLSSDLAHADGTRSALEKIPPDAPRLVLMHNPVTFDELPPHTAPLAMAGHTHGGQIKTPWFLLRRLLGKVDDDPKKLSGWAHDRGQPGNRLYINRGIGFSRLPIRFNAPPELTLFRLHRAGTAAASVADR